MTQITIEEVLEKLYKVFAARDNISVKKAKNKVIEYCSIENPLIGIWSKSNDLSMYQSPEYKYVSLAGYYLGTKESILYLSKKLRDLHVYHLLDYGCGVGIVSFLLSIRSPQLNIVGYDISKEELEIFGGLIKYFKVKNISITDRPIKSQAVCSIEVIEHHQDLNVILNEILKYCSEYFAYTATFSQLWPGHYKSYLLDNVKYANSEIKPKFIEKLGESFNLIYSGPNGRPAILERK